MNYHSQQTLQTFNPLFVHNNLFPITINKKCKLINSLNLESRANNEEI